MSGKAYPPPQYDCSEIITASFTRRAMPIASVSPPGRSFGASLGYRTSTPKGVSVRVSQRLSHVRAHRRHPVQQFRDVVRLREFDLVPNQESLQIFLSRLLAVKSDDFPEAVSLCTKLLRCVEVRRSFVEPLQDQPTECDIRRLHRGRVRTSGPGKRSLR